LSVAVKIWVEKLDYRSIEIPTSRKPHHQRKGETDESFLARRLSQGANRSKRLTFAHREALKVLADHARHNGLTWPGMPTIAKELGVKERQAFRVIADLELADLVKIHEGGGRGHSNHYWVRVPWVQEPERVLDLPLLDNKHYPTGARLKRDESGKVTGIDVDYYVRIASLKTLSPVTGFIGAEAETLSPVAPFSPETLTPVTPFSSQTPSPVTGESPSLRESSSSFESPSLARAARKQVGENDEDEHETANVQPTLPRFGVLSVPRDGPAPEPQTKPCPDCSCPVTVEGAGHRGGADRCRAYGRSADVERCPTCPEWIDKRQPMKWHSIRCPIRRQLLEGTAAGPQVDQVADGVALDRGVVPLSAEDSALADELQRKLEQVRATENGEQVEEPAPARPSRRRRERVAV